MREIPFGKPFIDKAEQNAVKRVLENPILVHGPKSIEFEDVFSRFTNSPSAVSCSSCTAALHLAYFSKNIGKGDEVIVPALTHVATAHTVALTGAKPVFVDAEMNTGNIDIDLIEHRINENTRAISVVHFLGMPVDMGRIDKIAQKYDLLVVEDCALALGSTINGVHVGMHGDCGCFSFYPVKHITTSEGGMFISKHKDYSDKVRLQRAFCVDKHHGEGRKIPGSYDVVGIGFNYRMSEISAAIGVEQMKKLQDFLRKREFNYALMKEHLENIDEIRVFRSSHGKFRSSYYCMNIILADNLIDKREEIIGELNDNGVGTSIYYPKPVPLMSVYKNLYGFEAKDFPAANKISSSSISLPVGPHLHEEDMAYISNTLAKAIEKLS